MELALHGTMLLVFNGQTLPCKVSDLDRTWFLRRVKRTGKGAWFTCVK